MNTASLNSYFLNFTFIYYIYEKIPADMYVIHPLTPLNTMRATDEDLNALSKNRNIIDVVQPKTGYTISNDDQKEEVQMIYDKFMLPILDK